MVLHKKNGGMLGIVDIRKTQRVRGPCHAGGLVAPLEHFYSTYLRKSGLKKNSRD
jgi:hypothetical protein